MASSEITYDDNATGIISVEKARRILGELSKKLDDNQVREIILSLHLLAREQLCYNGSKENGGIINELKISGITK